MTDIKTWSEIANNNNQVAPDGSPEQMKRSDVNDAVREMMRAIRKDYSAAEFTTVYETVGDAWLASFSAATIVQLAPQDAQTTDISGRFLVGTRVRLSGGASPQLGFIVSSSFSTPNTFVTVEIDDAAAVDGATNLLETGTVRDLLGKTAYYPTGVTLAQTPPQVPTIDDLGDGATLDQGTGNGFDADTVDGQHAADLIASAASGGGRNPIYNGEFMIWQRGVTIDASTTSGITNINSNTFYCADRWKLLSGNGTGSKDDVMDVTLSTTAPPVGFWSNLRLTRTATSVATQDFAGILQILDGKDTSAFLQSTAVSITVRLKASAGITGAVVRVLGWTGTVDVPTADPINDWGTAGGDPTLNASWVSMLDSGQLAVTGAWAEFKTENIDISSFTSLKNMAILITTDDASFLATDTLEITGVQIENGASSTTFGHRDYATELMRCERYYHNTFNDGVRPRNATGELSALQMISINRTNSGDINFAGEFLYPIQMRVVPTITVFNPVNDVDGSFYDNRAAGNISGGTVTQTILDRRTMWTLVNQLGGRIISAHAEADAEF